MGLGSSAQALGHSLPQTQLSDSLPKANSCHALCMLQFNYTVSYMQRLYRSLLGDAICYTETVIVP